MEEYCPNDEVEKLESEFWNHMANRLTTDGIKDGIFKKKENVGNKKRKLSCVWTMQASGSLTGEFSTL
nr:hypothetical protein [Tanacetum cinerariifolium]